MVEQNEKKLKIFTLLFEEKDLILNNENTFEIGYYKSINKEGGIKLDLFCIKGSLTQFFIEHAPEVCGKLLKHLNIDNDIDEVNWNYVASPAYSALKFIRINEKLAMMRH